MTNTFYYNTIYVIESLDDSEYNTGIKLYETVKKFEYKYDGVKTFLELPSTKSELFEVLSNIVTSVRNNNCLPIIHLEIHGNKCGIQCSNKDFIIWEELYPYLIEINVMLKNTLIITSGICFGTHLYFNININKPAPFFSLISSIGKIENQVILNSYEEFYNEFLKSENINKAVSSLNLDFLKPTHNEIILEPLIVSLLTEYKKLVTDLPAKINFSIVASKKKISETDRIDFYNNAIKIQDELFIETLKTIWFTYLMLDLYPETKDRYKNIKDIILDNIDKIEVSEKLKINLKKEVLIKLH